MIEPVFRLGSVTSAIVGMGDAIHLIEQKERVEQALISGDAPLTLDTSKALLESVLKTILVDRQADPDLGQDMNPLFRSVKDSLVLNRNADADDIFKRIGSNLVHQVSELRNRFGAASHGDDAFYENPIEMPEVEMVAKMVDALSGLLIFKHKANNDPNLAARIFYNDYPEFNDFVDGQWDGQWDGYELPLGVKQTISMSASKILFSTDEQAYREMLLQYLSTEEEDQVEEQADE